MYLARNYKKFHNLVSRICIHNNNIHFIQTTMGVPFDCLVLFAKYCAQKHPEALCNDHDGNEDEDQAQAVVLEEDPVQGCPNS